jgi:hypothetical protein
MRHDCPGGCGRSVAYERLACSGCWYRLPLDLRTAVWDTWKARRAHPAAHRMAVSDAYQWYRHHGPVT